MQSESSASPVIETLDPNCVFCQHSSIANYILKETSTFRIIADIQDLQAKWQLFQEEEKDYVDPTSA